MDTKLLFLSDGELGVICGGSVRMLTSRRKEKYMATTRSLEERNAWKYEGAGAQFMRQQNPYESMRRMAEHACRVTAAAPCGEELLYALVTPDMGGLYLKNPEDDAAEEGNWISERTFMLRDLFVREGQIVCALDAPRGECHIALMRADRSGYSVITQGDTQDTAPFLCADGRTLYYASAGYARTEEGAILAKGPSALLKLDLRSGSLDEVYEDDEFDYLRPKEAPDGSLYFIRRPYQPNGPRRPFVGERIRGVGVFFKGVGMLFKYLGDPEGARKQPRLAGRSQEETQQRMLEGVLLDITRSRDDGVEGQENGCVPDSWLLMRRGADGALTEVLRGVADYDFDGNALVYSDGRRIIRVEDGRKTVLHRAMFIPRVTVWR